MASLLESNRIKVKFSTVQEVSARDHGILENRDQPDQHPIEAVSGLKKELDDKINRSEQSVLTNQELEDLLK